LDSILFHSDTASVELEMVTPRSEAAFKDKKRLEKEIKKEKKRLEKEMKEKAKEDKKKEKEKEKAEKANKKKKGTVICPKTESTDALPANPSVTSPGHPFGFFVFFRQDPLLSCLSPLSLPNPLKPNEAGTNQTPTTKPSTKPPTLVRTRSRQTNKRPSLLDSALCSNAQLKGGSKVTRTAEEKSKMLGTHLIQVGHSAISPCSASICLSTALPILSPSPPMVPDERTQLEEAQKPNVHSGLQSIPYGPRVASFVPASAPSCFRRKTRSNLFSTSRGGGGGGGSSNAAPTPSTTPSASSGKEFARALLDLEPKNGPNALLSRQARLCLLSALLRRAPFKRCPRFFFFFPLHLSLADWMGSRRTRDPSRGIGQEARPAAVDEERQVLVLHDQLCQGTRRRLPQGKGRLAGDAALPQVGRLHGVTAQATAAWSQEGPRRLRCRRR